MREQIRPESQLTWPQKIQVGLGALVAGTGIALMILFVEVAGYMEPDCNDLTDETLRQKCLARTAEVEGFMFPWGLAGVAVYLSVLCALSVGIAHFYKRWQQLGWWRPGLTFCFGYG